MDKQTAIKGDKYLYYMYNIEKTCFARNEPDGRKHSDWLFAVYILHLHMFSLHHLY